jgi:hypothetical protein
MTNLEAADELERISRVCTTTKLSIAAMMGANLLRQTEQGTGTVKHDCPTCKHRDRMPGMYPCSECEEKYSDAPSNWEPKEG